MEKSNKGEETVSELSTYMDKAQELAARSSELTTQFSDVLLDCRSLCKKNLTKLFKDDFKSLMNDPVETIRVEIKVAAPDPKADEKYMKKKRELSEKINAGEQRAREKRELIEKINACRSRIDCI